LRWASGLERRAFLLALLALLFFHFYVFRHVGGYELRALGLAPKAAEYGGVAVGRKVVLVMFLSGALAGLAAAHYVLGGGMGLPCKGQEDGCISLS
jgi:ABC-type uncharacterized transport system permease subunit